MTSKRSSFCKNGVQLFQCLDKDRKVTVRMRGACWWTEQQKCLFCIWRRQLVHNSLFAATQKPFVHKCRVHVCHHATQPSSIHEQVPVSFFLQIDSADSVHMRLILSGPVHHRPGIYWRLCHFYLSPSLSLGENRVPVTSDVSYSDFTPPTFQRVPMLTVRWPIVILASSVPSLQHYDQLW